MCLWKKLDQLIISSHSLQRLALNNSVCHDEMKNTGFVLIDTPHLQYLDYYDNLSQRYSVAHMNILVEACIFILCLLRWDDFQDSFRTQLSLLRSLSDVQHLSLLGTAAENIGFAGELKDQLPVFRKLRTLKLGAITEFRWDTVLLPIIDCSPLLETLVFLEGLFDGISDIYFNTLPSIRENASMEAEGWRTNQTIPSGCLTHLKRIELNHCFGIDRELNMIKFLLVKASVLEEFVISLECLSEGIHVPRGTQLDAPDLVQFESTLKELPMSSNSCSIIVQR